MRKYIYLILLMCLVACRTDEVIVPSEEEQIPDKPDVNSAIRGFYLLNEGNMGSNKSTLDYYDFTTGTYSRNIYAERNPGVIKELGDVGNDIGIYGSKMYVVVNCSHKVEVLEATSGVRIGQVDIPNCRYVRFYNGKAYVSSYIGPVAIDPKSPLGAVFEVDTTSLTITNRVDVGYQPEEMEIIDGYMYVANSGGYRAPDYDNTVSVVDMSTFTQVKQIPVGINLHRLKVDKYDRIWVNSRGNAKTIHSRLHVMERSHLTGEMEVIDTLDIACSNMAIHGDSLYYYATEWSNITSKNEITYGIVDLRTKQVVSTQFITDGTDAKIKIPYGIAIHPETGDIFITDAKNYVSSGTLYCFDRDGRMKWSVRTGDIPAHITFLYK